MSRPSTQLERRLPPGELLPPEPYYTSPGVLRSMLRASGIFGLAMIVAIAVAFASSSLPLLVFVLGGVGYAGISIFRVYQGANRNVSAVQDLNSGRVDAAAEAFESLARDYQYHPHHPLFVHNRAVCYLVDGHLKRAVSLFNAARRSNKLKSLALSRFRHFPTTQLALALGLLGEIREADRILKEAEDDPKYAIFGMTVLPRAVILLRSGQPGRAADHLTRHWTEAEGLAAGRSAKALRIVRAFALHQAGGDARAIERMMAGIYPYEPSEIQWLWVEWPELRTFCAGHL